jgi:hypothetical protein
MFTAICFYMLVSSVLALSANTFTSVFLGSAWLVLTFLSVLWSWLSVGASCFLLIRVDLISLSLHNEHLVSLDGLGGGEGGVQRSAVHVKLLSLVLSLHLHGDLLRLCVFVLDDDDDAGVEYCRRQRSASDR